MYFLIIKEISKNLAIKIIQEFIQKEFLFKQEDINFECNRFAIEKL
jgi:hypothetical protein